MKFYNSIYLIFILTFLLFSCQKESKSDELRNIDFIDVKYNHLEEYEWLNNYKNFEDENYKKKIKKYFEQNLKEKKYENAAAYLIVSGNIIDGKYIYDSIYHHTALDFYSNHKNHISKEAQSYLCYYIGNQYNIIKNSKEGNSWLNKCIEIDAEANYHKKIQGFANFSLAQNNLKIEDLEKAEKYLIDALAIFEEIGEIRNQGTVYLLLHKIYTRNNAYKEAEKYIDDAIKIFKEDKACAPLLFSANSFYVDYYIKQEDTVSALKRIDSLSNYVKNWKNISEYEKGIAMHKKVFKYFATKQKDSALYYMQKEKGIAEKTDSRDHKINLLYNEVLFSNTFHEPIENAKEAEDFYKELAEEKSQNLQPMAQIATALFSFYSDNKAYEKANEYASLLIEIKTKQNEALTKGRLFELERKFETERKEKTILLQEKKLSEKNKIILLLAAATVFIVLISFIVFVWNKNRSIIKEKKITENYASQLLQKTENERKRIASDLHDSVSNELINLRHTIESKDSRLKSKIDFILEEIRNISRNISPTLFDKIGLKLSVEQLIDRIQTQHDFFISSEIDYRDGLNHDKELQLYRIIQEAITNILKHANAVAGKVSIKETPKTVTVEIRDNGKGFNVEKMLEKGNCFGLLNITERAKYLNGTVNFQSDNSGTLIKIVIQK